MATTVPGCNGSHFYIFSQIFPTSPHSPFDLIPIFSVVVDCPIRLIVTTFSFYLTISHFFGCYHLILIWFKQVVFIEARSFLQFPSLSIDDINDDSYQIEMPWLVVQSCRLAQSRNSRLSPSLLIFQSCSNRTMRDFAPTSMAMQLPITKSIVQTKHVCSIVALVNFSMTRSIPLVLK